ncbi:MAG: hypothetical protein Q8L34_02585, partial [Candidatus Woesearchaeota archaeon]|nr:hypothetical protein [Candidatus Woesearchaeota archaeon]
SFLFYAYSNDISSFPKDYNFRHTQAASQVCCLFINNYSEIYPVNTTYQMFFLGNSLSNLTEITIKATHPTRCPIINWTDARRLSTIGAPAEGEVKVKMTVITNDQAGNCLPSDSRFKQIESDAILNRTSDNTIFSQILFLDNLTNDPNQQGYNFLYGESLSSASKERPTIFINSANNTVETPSSVGNNILYLLQYDNPIKWEVTLKYSVGPLEVYSTETVTASLPSLNVSRIHRPARFK